MSPAGDTNWRLQAVSAKVEEHGARLRAVETKTVQIETHVTDQLDVIHRDISQVVAEVSGLRDEQQAVRTDSIRMAARLGGLVAVLAAVGVAILPYVIPAIFPALKS